MPSVSIDGYNIVSNHVYAMVGYYAPFGWYEVFNPRGLNQTQADSYMFLTFSELTDIFGSYDVGTNPGNIATVAPFGSAASHGTSGGAGASFLQHHDAPADSQRWLDTGSTNHVNSPDMQTLIELLANNQHHKLSQLTAQHEAQAAVDTLFADLTRL